MHFLQNFNSFHFCKTWNHRKRICLLRHWKITWIYMILYHWYIVPIFCIFSPLNPFLSIICESQELNNPCIYILVWNTNYLFWYYISCDKTRMNIFMQRKIRCMKHKWPSKDSRTRSNSQVHPISGLMKLIKAFKVTIRRATVKPE